MKTKEEILEEYFGSDYFLLKERDDLQYILRAMEVYAAQFKPNEQQGGVVRPVVESAREGELLPESVGEANTCAGKITCDNCGKSFDKVTQLWNHYNRCRG